MAQRVSSASQGREELLLGSQTQSGLRDLLTRALARLRHSRLDAALASGADPCDSPALACRAAWLTRSRNREKLAASIDHLLAAAERPVLRLSSAVEADHREVTAASRFLVGLGELLRSGVPVYAQGVAMLVQLLRDGGGPLYLATWRGALELELRVIIASLEGRDRPLGFD